MEHQHLGLAEVQGLAGLGELFESFPGGGVGHFVRKRQHPGPAIRSRRCLDEELCSDRPYRNPRSYVPQSILLLVLVREDPFGR